MIGTHYILEMYDCPVDVLDNEKLIADVIRTAVERAGLNLLKLATYKFTPQGVTAVGLISESHVSIHTWPEYGYCAADVFTCGSPRSAKIVVDHLLEAFSPADYELKRFKRGARIDTSKLVTEQSGAVTEPVLK